jgi:acyl carrier protein
VAHVWLISGIESEFGITIDTAESLEVKSFDQARALLVERGVA